MDNEIARIFRDKEKEELKILNELTQDATINGEPIVGFRHLLDLIEGRRKISTFTREELLKVYIQLKGYNEFWQNADWFDAYKTESIAKKLKEIINLRSHPPHQQEP